jgi:hypothetical protein
MPAVIQLVTCRNSAVAAGYRCGDASVRGRRSLRRPNPEPELTTVWAPGRPPRKVDLDADTRSDMITWTPTPRRGKCPVQPKVARS